MFWCNLAQCLLLTASKCFHWEASHIVLEALYFSALLCDQQITSLSLPLHLPFDRYLWQPSSLPQIFRAAILYLQPSMLSSPATILVAFLLHE